MPELLRLALKHLDPNGDGHVDEAEAAAFVKKADADGDGLVSTAELQALPKTASTSPSIPTKSIVT